jgi:hypothetical protein
MAKERMYGVHGTRSDSAIIASVMGGLPLTMMGRGRRGGGGRGRRGPIRRGGRGIAFYDQGFLPYVEEAPVIIVPRAQNIDPAMEIKRALLPTIMACHQRALRRTPGLSGKIAVQFEIQPDGRATKFAITADTLGSPEVSLCISRMIQSHLFQAPGQVVSASFPFIFQVE